MLSRPGADGEIATVVLLDEVAAPGHMQYEARLRRRADQFLGEPCVPMSPCATGLTCRLRVGSSVPRCVPAD